MVTVVDMPQDLQSDSPAGSERLAVRALQTMDLIQRQLDRIGYLRSAGHHWGPAVEHLRSLLVGLEDEEFWDGLPKASRERVKQLEADPENKRALRDAQRIRDTFRDQGWQGVSVHAVPGPGGRPRFRPTAQDLDQMMEILMRLMDRRKLRWKTRGQSALPPVPGSPVGGDDGRD